VNIAVLKYWQPEAKGINMPSIIRVLNNNDRMNEKVSVQSPLFEKERLGEIL
jgi:hypothetical protein